MKFFTELKSKFFGKKDKKIAFLDGDQNIPSMLSAYDMYLKGIETHLVRVASSKNSEPKILRKLDANINKIYLMDYTVGKEITDKFIGAYIQKAVDDGYTHITVVSSDYDFIDIFKMAVILNPAAIDVSFRMIVPDAQGRLADVDSKVMNIEIVKMKDER